MPNTGRVLLTSLMLLAFAACGGGSRPTKTEVQPTVTCGNGAIDTGEDCDGAELGGVTCLNRGYTSGTLKCTTVCTFDTSACANSAKCGNGRIESGEVCDKGGLGTPAADANLNGETCETQHFAGGTLKCGGSCAQFDTTGCQPASCGNNRREGTEICDGTDIGTMTCAQLGFGGGTLTCKASSSCSEFETSACTGQPAQCGNNHIDNSNEVCDGSDLGGKTCQSLRFTGGNLACKAGANCRELDTSGCTGTPAGCTGPDVYRQQSPALNVNLADGEPCNFASDCVSHSCNSSYYCGAEGVGAIVHDGDLPLGRACDVDGSCLSGYCFAGGDSYVCAEPCATPITATTAGLECQADEVSPTGAACIPGPGAGAVGAACVSGAFDCKDGLCFDESFCTKQCDPTAAATDPNGCTAAATCELLGVDPIYGAIYICVATSRPRQAEGGSCQASFDCVDPLACVAGTCRRPCPAGTECIGDTYCATDYPGGAVCLPNGSRKGVGEACSFNGECQTTLVCFDEGTGATCHDTCAAGSCSGGLHCVQVEAGPALDTVVEVYNASSATTVWGQDDDSGPGYFSLLSKALDLSATSTTYYVRVTRYDGSPAGPYDLSVSLDAAVAASTTNEVEPNDVWTTNPLVDQAQALTMPAKVKAMFVDQGATADVDWFKVVSAANATGNLTVATTAASMPVCITGAALAPDGAQCVTDATCQNDCFPFIRVGTESFCAKACAQSSECAGGICQLFNDMSPAQGYCFPAGAVGLGNRTFGQSCTGPHDCASHVCLKHKYGATYQCGDACTAANSACGAAGMCSAADPIYGTACVPTLSPKAAPGAHCVWDADCSAGNVCVAELCQPENALSNYNPTPGAVGTPCNLDSDCASATCVDYCCVDVGGGATTCGGNGDLANGRPCNGDADCLSGYCFAGGNTWFCADTCSGPTDVTCTGNLYTGVPVACQLQPDATYACVPNAGVGAPGDPCRSDYLDCASNWCWQATFCVDTCSLSGLDCGRNAGCVFFDQVTADTTRQTDTQITILSTAGAELVPPVDDNHLANGTLVSYYSPTTFTNTGGSARYVLVKVEGVVGAVGDYQLQVFTELHAPPFTLPIAESELRTPPVTNDTIGDAQDLGGVGQPQRVQASLASGTDVDYYRVAIGAGETLTALTTFSLGSVCWPNREMNRVEEALCSFDFECTSGTCLGYCARECTGGATCAAEHSCSAFLGDYRSFCFRSLKFDAGCAEAATGLLNDVPSCPNSLCMTRDSQTLWCSDYCWGIGLGCGWDDVTAAYTGECTIYDDRGGAFGLQSICAPHLGGAVADGVACMLDADCTNGCCDEVSGLCGSANCNITRCVHDDECGSGCCDQTTLGCADPPSTSCEF
ncbi:MAG: hypothetical protein HY903_19355 [Deltaproteobacteria bacterium]|nr:hypothetical protein [Deltaproteobacteria bacterium]